MSSDSGSAAGLAMLYVLASVGLAYMATKIFSFVRLVVSLNMSGQSVSSVPRIINDDKANGNPAVHIW